MSKFRTLATNEYRFRLHHRWFRDPFIVLQRQVRHERDVGYASVRWELQETTWVDVSIEDLSQMSLPSLIKPREPDSLPICFKPLKRLFGWSLVLMICESSWAEGHWRPARLQDLMIKDGKIQGGLGLVRR